MIRQEWLQALAPEAPCGPNLEYEPDFLALEQAARGKEEQQYGKTVIPAEEPDWADVVSRASSLLDRSRDLRIVVHLTRGMTRTQGLVGLRDCLSLIAGLLESFWEPLHPQLVSEGETDPFMRMGALTSLGDAEGIVRDVRSALFLKCPLGTFTVRDVERILDPKAPVAEQLATADQLNSVVRDAIAADIGALSEAAQSLEALERIRAVVLSRLEAAQVPDFALLGGLLKSLAGVSSPIREELRRLADPSAAAGDAAPGTAGVVPTGEIRTRDDAVRALERVCEYLGRNEPTSPAPLLIRRAQRLMTMQFMDIIKDLAPDAIGQVETVTGAKQA